MCCHQAPDLGEEKEGKIKIQQSGEYFQLLMLFFSLMFLSLTSLS